VEGLQGLIGTNEFHRYGYAASEVLGIVITTNFPKTLSFHHNKRLFMQLFS
jgi:hypothetical protein